MESLLTTFEIGVTIASIQIELRTERYVRNSSKFIIKIEKIDARKLKKKTDSTIHSVSINIGTCEGQFQQIGENSPKKLFALQRVEHKGEPSLSSHALQMTIEVLKKPGQTNERKTVVRGSLASLQCILTLLTCVDIFKVIDKLVLFGLKQKYMDQGILEMVNYLKQFHGSQEMHDTGIGL